MNYVYEIYKVLEARGCEQISMKFDEDYKVLEVKYKRKNQITDEYTNEMFTIVPKNYKTEKDLRTKVIRELYCIWWNRSVLRMTVKELKEKLELLIEDGKEDYRICSDGFIEIKYIDISDGDKEVYL